MCIHCNHVHYPRYKEAEACATALAQRKKFEEEVLNVQVVRPPFKVRMGEHVAKRGERPSPKQRNRRRK